MPKTQYIDIEAQKDLVARVLAGEEKAKEAFFLLHRDRLLKTASSFVGWQDPEAEDLVHEAVMAGLKDLSKFEFRSSLMTWLTQICAHLCLKSLRRRRRQVVETGEALESMVNWQGLDEAARLREQEAAGEQWSRVKAGMAALKDGCREILEARYSQGLAYASISQALRLPIGTVMSRLARCKETLKSLVTQVETVNV